MLKKQWLKQREELLARGCGVFSQRQSCNYQNILDRGTDKETVFPGKVGLSPSAWPSVQKIGNNKAVFPGNPNLKKERTGTGVFLPRFVDTESSRKKPGKKINLLLNSFCFYYVKLNVNAFINSFFCYCYCICSK